MLAQRGTQRFEARKSYFVGQRWRQLPPNRWLRICNLLNGRGEAFVPAMWVPGLRSAGGIDKWRVPLCSRCVQFWRNHVRIANWPTSLPGWQHQRNFGEKQKLWIWLPRKILGEYFAWGKGPCRKVANQGLERADNGCCCFRASMVPSGEWFCDWNFRIQLPAKLFRE